MLAGSGAAMSAAAAKGSAASRGFCSFLDGCLTDDGGVSEPQDANPRPLPPGKNRTDGFMAPPMPIPTVATVPLAHASGPEQLGRSGAMTAAPQQGAPGAYFQGFSDGSGSAPVGSSRVGSGESRGQKQHSMSSEKNQTGGLADSTPITVPAMPTVPYSTTFGLGQLENFETATAASDEPVNEEGKPDRTSGSGSALETAAFRAGIDGANPFAGDIPVPQDDANSYDDSQAMADPSELAFGARLLKSEPAETYSAAAGAPPATPAAAASAPPAPASLPIQPKVTEIPATPHGAHAMPLDSGPSSSQAKGISANSPDSSDAPAEAQTSIPQQRDTGSPAGIVTKTAVSSEHPASSHGPDAPAGPADGENVWNTAVPSAAGPDTPPAAPAPPASLARPAEVDPPQPAAQPASRDVSLHLGDGESGVDIRMAERAGEIRVTVHTPDRDLADSLRSDLPDLVGKLRQNGFQAEAWRPAAGAQADTGRRSGSDAQLSQEHSPGARRDGRQRQPQQQQSKNQSRWTGEWNSSLDPAQESRT